MVTTNTTPTTTTTAIPDEDIELHSTITNAVNSLPSKQSISTLKSLLKSSTTSMTSVPKPLKYLHPLFNDIVSRCTTTTAAADDDLNELLSVVGMTCNRSLEFAPISNSILDWGHDYIRQLCLEISAKGDKSDTKSLSLCKIIIPFLISSQQETDAVDLAVEMGLLDYLCEHCTDSSVCLYMERVAEFSGSVDISAFIIRIYLKDEKFINALLVAIKYDKDINAIYESIKDDGEKLQAKYILSRFNISLGKDDDDAILTNQYQATRFQSFCRELDTIEPKLPEDIYKTHLEYRSAAQVDSARQNLSGAIVNALLNCAYSNDKLSKDEQFVYRNKQDGMISATASLGLLYLWDIELGLTQIDKYLYSQDDNVKAGALLAVGLVCANQKHPSDPAIALLSEYVGQEAGAVRLMSVLGLGVAYAGSRREDVRELLSEKILSSDLELSAMASLALSLVFHSTLDGDIQSSILQQLMEHTKEIEEEKEGNDLLLRIFAVSLGVLALKQRDSIETLLETVSVLESEKVRDCVKVALIGCAYVGSGNVLKTQLLLNDYAAVPLTPIALSLIAIQDVIGGDLLINKLFLTLFHYSPVEVKRMIPLAISLLSLSNPQPSTIDLLSKYSHDHDADTATSAIISMGLLGGGSNNARLAQLMRQLAGYYHKDQAMLFVVRIAQGLLHMGKGVLSLGVSRYGVLNYDAVVGVLVFCCLVGGKMFETRHYFTYLLVLAIHSRYLITIKGEDEEIKTAVRVGKGVEAKAGRVRITGFQTHDTPVLLGCGEIAELVEYDDCGVVEGVVVVKKKKDGEVVV